MQRKKEIAIFGATGSIGSSTINIIRANSDKFSCKVLTANQNKQKLIALAKEFLPQYICIADDQHYEYLKAELSNLPIKIMAGKSGMQEASLIENDLTVAAITGISGLPIILNALTVTKYLALANKEAVVCAGELLNKLCKEHNTTLLPIDSEHNSLFQLLEGKKQQELKHITITASGGPFLKHEFAELQQVTVQDTLNHPNWQMGNKITVDSATMVNKALELIEAHFLFNLAEENIKTIIHPESIIHALVHYIDGSVQALLGSTDMRVAIAHALAYPTRIVQDDLLIDLTRVQQLNFIEADPLKTKAILLAREVIRQGGIKPIVFNAINEICVELFLAEKLSFLAIVETIAKILPQFSSAKIENIEHIFAVHDEVIKVTKQQTL